MVVSIPLYQIDAFSDRPFGGNPAAVCLLPPELHPLPDATLQSIAAEMNLSETAFVSCTESQTPGFAGATRFGLRWFTPTMEVPLCGHATLAAAAAIFNGTENAADCLFFDTLSGELSVKRDAATGMLSMDLPLLEPGSNLPSEDFEANSELIQAALSGTPAVQVEEILFEPSLRYLVVRLGTAKGTEISRDQFEATQPNIARMHAAHAGGQLVGIILTVPGPEGGPHDFLSRFFAPWAGIEEDPVTGSAHSVLGPLWTKRLGKSELAARQCSKRGGELKVVVDFERHRVVVKGEAAMVVRGELLV